MATFYPCNKTISTVNIKPTEASPSGLITSNRLTYQARECFVKTCVDAYNHHYKLILTPDVVWLAIMTQFAVYLEKYATELRSKFVAHEGKKELCV